MKIWGRTNSTNVRKVLWAAEELGISYQQIDAGGAFGVVSEPGYLAQNPNGLVPCIDDDGFILWESNSIVRYLINTYGAQPFRITDGRDLALADKWMDWASLSFAAPFRNLFWNLVRQRPELRNEDEIALGKAGCEHLMHIADTALKDSPFLSGEHLGMGDIPLGCIAYAWFSLPIERPDLPNLSAWYERLQLRPAYQKAVMTPLT